MNLTWLAATGAVQAAAAPVTAGLHPADFVMVVLYLLLTAGIVVWSALRQTGTDSFFLGNRQMPWWAVGLSIMATLLSSISYLGLTGEMVKHGASMFGTYLGWPFAMLLVVPLVIPFFMSLRLTNAYGYLEQRFDRRVRVLGSVLFLLLRLGWIAMVMFTASLALSSMAGWDLPTVILLLGVVAAISACFGGFEAVIWTDVLQALMLFGGAACIVLFVWLKTGAGPTGWWETATAVQQTHTRPVWFSADPRVRMTFFTVAINGFFWQFCTHLSDQVVLQRYSSTPSLAAARKSYLVNMLSALSIGVLLGLAGLALLHFYTVRPERLAEGMTPTASGDRLMPWFYAHELPTGFAGLILANFLCDAMQTLVAGVNSIAAVAVADLRGDADQAGQAEAAGGAGEDRGVRQLRSARLLTLGLGLICTFSALGIHTLSKQLDMNIVDLMPRAFNLFLGPLAALFVCGLFVPRVTARAMLPAGLLAVGISVVWSYWRPLTGKGYDLSPNWAIWVPCVSGVVLATLFSLFDPTAGRHTGRQWSWRAVMRTPAGSNNGPTTARVVG
jgi:SSS family transporter